MSHTAYSQKFAHELDVKQLLKRLGIAASLEQADYGLSQAQRDWMRGDLLCPSCRCGGASLVRSDVSKGRGRNTRQAHFRFIDSAGYTAHALGCDFYSLDDVPGVQKGTEVRFIANDNDTKIVRELVCKAINIGELKATDIFSMRSWFLGQRGTNTFQVKGAPAMVDWLWAIHWQLGFEAVKFEPYQAAMPGFNPRFAALRDLSFLYRDFRKQMPRVRFDVPERDRAKRIILTQPEQTLISMEALRPKFEMTVRVAGLMTEYGDLPIKKRRSLGSIYSQTPEALVAFSAALLYVSDWDENVAFACFARIIAAEPPEDMTLGNVIGLNPFHDFGALEIARFTSSLPPMTERAYDFDAELAAAVAKMDAVGGAAR